MKILRVRQINTNDNAVYTKEEIAEMIGILSVQSLTRLAKKYRDTGGKEGIPNIQLAGPGSRVIFPKKMIEGIPRL